MNAIRAEDAELAFIIPAKVNETTPAFSGTGEGYLVNRSNAVPIFVLQQHNRLARHGRRQTEIGKFNQFAGDRWLRLGEWGLRLRVHLMIEAEAMYLLK